MLTRNVLLPSVLLVLLAASAIAQTPTATLSGAIRDASAAFVPGAQVSVTNAESGTKRTTSSDETGRYILTNLPPGRYDVRAELTGFRTAVQNGVVLTVGGSTSVDHAPGGRGQ